MLETQVQMPTANKKLKIFWTGWESAAVMHKGENFLSFLTLESWKHLLIDKVQILLFLWLEPKCTVISSHASLPLRHQLCTNCWLGNYSNNLWRKQAPRVQEPLGGATHTWIPGWDQWRPVTPTGTRNPDLTSAYTQRAAVCLSCFFLLRVGPRDEPDTPAAHMTGDVWRGERTRYS